MMCSNVTKSINSLTKGDFFFYQELHVKFKPIKTKIPRFSFSVIKNISHEVCMLKKNLKAQRDVFNYKPKLEFPLFLASPVLTLSSSFSSDK